MSPLALRAGFDWRAARTEKTRVVRWEWGFYFYFRVWGRCARRGDDLV